MTEQSVLKIFQPTPPRHVSQEMLRKYLRLQKELRKTKRSLKRLRQVLLDAKTFEEGSLTYTFEERMSDFYSIQEMRRNLHPSVVTGILLNIDPREYFAVLIQDMSPRWDPRPGETRG